MKNPLNYSDLVKFWLNRLTTTKHASLLYHTVPWLNFKSVDEFLEKSPWMLSDIHEVQLKQHLFCILWYVFLEAVGTWMEMYASRVVCDPIKSSLCCISTELGLVQNTCTISRNRRMSHSFSWNVSHN